MRRVSELMSVAMLNFPLSKDSRERVKAARQKLILAKFLYMTLFKGLRYENQIESNFQVIYRAYRRFDISTFLFQVHPDCQGKAAKAKKGLQPQYLWTMRSPF